MWEGEKTGKEKGFWTKPFLRALQTLILRLKSQWWYWEAHQGSICVLGILRARMHTGWIPHYYQKNLNQACSQWMWLQPLSVLTFGFWVTPDTGDAIFSRFTQTILPEYPKVPVGSYLLSPRNWNCNLFIHFRLCCGARHMGAHMSVLTLRAVSQEGGRTGMGRKSKSTLTVHWTPCHSWETGDVKQKHSMNWSTGIQGKTETPWSKASPRRLGVLNLTQEKVFYQTATLQVGQHWTNWITWQME